MKGDATVRVTTGVLLSALTLVGMLAGCAPDTALNESDATPKSQSVSQLMDRFFLAKDISGKEPAELFGSEPRLVVRFGRDEGDPHPFVAWQATCNEIGGSLQAPANRLVVDVNFTTTVGCSPAEQRQDEWLTAFFSDRPTWRATAGRLVLASNEANIVLDEADPGSLYGPDQPHP